LSRRVQRGDLAHHRLVDRQAARGIDDQHVVIVRARVLERAPRDVDRLLVAVDGKKSAPACAATVLSCSIAAGR
jgi:hypothetical protein